MLLEGSRKHAAEEYAAAMVHQKAAVSVFYISPAAGCAEASLRVWLSALPDANIATIAADATTPTAAGLDAPWFLQLLLLSATATATIAAHGTYRLLML